MIIKKKKMQHILIFIQIAAIFTFGMPSSAVSYPVSAPVSAKAAVLMNADTGAVLFAVNPYESRAIASTTKIMTTILTLESGELNGDMDKPFRVDDSVIGTEGTSMRLSTGDIVTKRALCYGMMLPSGNDAAGAAAIAVGGSTEAFVRQMNIKAKLIGMKNTVYANPSGLDDFKVGVAGQHSTAYDMAVLTRYALQNPQFRRICSSWEMNLYYGNPPHRRTLFNNNKMLRKYDGCIGVKTGYTDTARRCLVSAATRNGVTLIAVTLNAPDDWNDHISMFNAGFAAAAQRNLHIDEKVAVAGAEGSYARAGLAGELYLPLTDEEMKRVRVKVNTVPFVYAGYKSGDFAGTVQVFFDGKIMTAGNLKIL